MNPFRYGCVVAGETPVAPGGQLRGTLGAGVSVYKAPFFKKCREDDYREAWEMLAKRDPRNLV